MDYKEIERQAEEKSAHYRMLTEYHWKECSRLLGESCEASKESREYLERAVKNIEER